MGVLEEVDTQQTQKKVDEMITEEKSPSIVGRIEVWYTKSHETSKPEYPSYEGVSIHGYFTWDAYVHSHTGKQKTAPPTRVASGLLRLVDGAGP